MAFWLHSRGPLRPPNQGTTKYCRATISLRLASEALNCPELHCKVFIIQFFWITGHVHDLRT